MSNDAIEWAQYKAQLVKETVTRLALPVVHDPIVDIGCGTGEVTYYLQELFFESTVIGIDSDSQVIAAAQKQFPMVTFYHDSVISCVHSYNASLVIIAFVLHHFPYAEHHSFIEKVMAQVRPGGYALFLELNGYRPDVQWLRWTDAQEKEASFITPWRLQKMLNNYAIIEKRFYSFYPFLLFEPLLAACPLGKFYSIAVQKH